MSVFEILDTLLLRPLQLLFEVIYMVADRIIGNPGLSIIVLSLVMNFLVLPLYLRADAMQEEEKQTEMRLRKGVSHIKKTFKGDERMMMLQTYYRQNGYKPTYVLRGAVSLFLEIPFFIAAYRFLSGLDLLNGVAFGPIADLGRPDGMLAVGGTAVNIHYDGGQPRILCDLYERKPGEAEDPAVRHGGLLPCIFIWFAVGACVLLDAEQYVLACKDGLL